MPIRVREVGLPERKLFVRVGKKRWFVILMFVAVPLVWAEPISGMQDAVPVIRREPPIVIKTPEIRIEKIKPPKPPKIRSSYGTASWYSETDPFINLRAANGEIFDDSRMACASWHYPFGTMLKVTNLANGKSVVVRVNDRGPAKRLHRLIDLTKAAFRKIGNTRNGLIKVRVTRVE